MEELQEGSADNRTDYQDFSTGPLASLVMPARIRYRGGCEQ